MEPITGFGEIPACWPARYADGDVTEARARLLAEQGLLQALVDGGTGGATPQHHATARHRGSPARPGGHPEHGSARRSRGRIGPAGLGVTNSNRSGTAPPGGLNPGAPRGTFPWAFDKISTFARDPPRPPLHTGLRHGSKERRRGASRCVGRPSRRRFCGSSGCGAACVSRAGSRHAREASPSQSRFATSIAMTFLDCPTRAALQ
jgi:hypothetical protein